MYEILITILIIFFVATFVISWLIIRKEKMKERLLLIEKGIDISNLPQNKGFRFSFPWLKVGIVVTSVPLGFLVGGVLEVYMHYSIGLPGLLAFLFVGFGMIIAHYIDKPKAEK
jgi:hypothetical protein